MPNTIVAFVYLMQFSDWLQFLIYTLLKLHCERLIVDSFEIDGCASARASIDMRILSFYASCIVHSIPKKRIISVSITSAGKL